MFKITNRFRDQEEWDVGSNAIKRSYHNWIEQNDR